jgi:hypothetical protein
MQSHIGHRASSSSGQSGDRWLQRPRVRGLNAAARSFLAGSGSEANQLERKPLNASLGRASATPSSMISRGSVLASVPGSLTLSVAAFSNFDDF